MDFPGAENTEELLAIATEFLYQQKVDCKVLEVYGKPSRFKAIISSKICKLEEMDDFVSTYSKQNNETLRI